MQFIFWSWLILIPSIIAVLFFWPELLTITQRIRGRYHYQPSRCTLPNDPLTLHCHLPSGHRGPCFIEVSIP